MRRPSLVGTTPSAVTLRHFEGSIFRVISVNSRGRSPRPEIYSAICWDHLDETNACLRVSSWSSYAQGNGTQILVILYSGYPKRILNGKSGSAVGVPLRLIDGADGVRSLKSNMLVPPCDRRIRRSSVRLGAMRR